MAHLPPKTGGGEGAEFYHFYISLDSGFLTTLLKCTECCACALRTWGRGEVRGEKNRRGVCAGAFPVSLEEVGLSGLGGMWKGLGSWLCVVSRACSWRDTCHLF